ncbi:O-acetylhomoserine sulfhydrylase [Candidatus Burkholderia brachyanthoides]|nr:O-acetylhomoserine sulfhydrylase [Candidatus Burkholderia brachyanthoides]
MDKQGFTTGIVHGDRIAGTEHGGVRQPIHTSVQYGFERVEDLIGVFQGTKKEGGFNYARQGTPTTAALERKITQLEEGVGTICFGTGMAAITATFLTLLRTGDHLVSSKYVFGNTNSLFGTLKTLGVDVTTVDACDAAQVKSAIRLNTRMVFVETIANPGTQIPDLQGIAEVCCEQGLAYVVDNTITSPALFKPKAVGASLVINSLTKMVAGHGAALGGAVTDTGLFDWSGYPNIADDYRRSASKEQGLLQIRKKGLRDMGAALSSEQAHSIAMGAETLALRVKQSSDNALALARFLEGHEAIGKVFYPGLKSHPQYEIAQALFKGASWLLSFELLNAERMIDVVNALKLPIKATGLADTRTLIIPVAPTIFFEAGADTRRAMGISDGMLRLSAGIEDIDDLIADFEQALKLAA